MIRIIKLNSYGKIGEESLTINGRFVHRLNYLYDLRGRLSSQTVWRGPESVQFSQTNYTYTPDGFLESVTGIDKFLYQYDANGNMISVFERGIETIATYDISDNLISWGNNVINVYDAAGRIIQQNDVHFSYTARGNIRHAWRKANFRLTFRHDYKGRVTSWENEQGNITQFFYVDLKRPLLPTHIHYPMDDITHALIYDHRGFIVSVRTNRDRFWINTDNNGSPISVYDSSGSLVKEIRRTPWGLIKYDSNPKLELHVDFQGGIREPTTGLILFGINAYNPKYGQWMAPQYDTVLDASNDITAVYLHRYKNNDPINRETKNVYYTGQYSINAYILYYLS